MLKIKDNRNIKGKKFYELKSGTIFDFCDNFFIKICEIVRDDDTCFNAVNLENGCLDCFDDSDEVEICCNVELVIND